MSDDKMMNAAMRGDKDQAPETGGKARGRRRRKVGYLTINKIETVDYKEVNILRKFINDRGKMLPSRQTGNTAKQQRMIARSIRRARELALLPFVVTEMSADRREYTPRHRDRRDGGYQGRDNRDGGGRDGGNRDSAPRESQEPAKEVAPAAAQE